MVGTIQIADILAATIRIGTPLVLVAIGVAFSIKAGIFNIAVEGLMLIGAFTAVYFSTYFSSLLIGTLIAVGITVIAAVIYGFVVITLRADQIIAGLGLNMLALGLTSWILQSVLQSPGGYTDPSTPKLPIIGAGALENIPILGNILFGQHVLTYVTWVIFILAYFFIHQSKFGLRLRATGEHPEAAITVGVNTTLWQHIALAIGGALCGLAGVALSMASLSLFTKGMTAGRGFIAFAAASFAAGNIPGTVAISYLFALFSSLAIRLEGLGIPTRYVQILPYFVTLVSLFFARRRIRE